MTQYSIDDFPICSTELESIHSRFTFINRCSFNITSQNMSHVANNCPFKVSEHKGGCQGVNEMRFSGDTLLTGVLLFESGANRSADGVSIWSLTCEICLNSAFPSSRAYKQSDRHHHLALHRTPHQLEQDARITQAHLHHYSRNSVERRGTPHCRAYSWSSTDPSTAGLCSPQHAPVVPGKMRFC